MKNLHNKTPLTLTKEEWEQVRDNQALRISLAKESLYWFFHIYFSHYITAETADFHREIFKNITDPKIRHAVIVAFRGSGKSTIVSMALPLWAMIGNMEKKFIVLVSQTQTQVQQHLRNLRDEIEANELFRNDFGSLETESNEWGISSLSITKLRAKIISVSRDQNIRGMRSGQHRPDLVIADDVEDTNSVRTIEGRNKTFDWFTSEVIPIGNLKTKFVTIGNMLHEDSLLMRLKDGFAAGTRSGKYSEYPLVKDGVPIWPGMYPNMEAVELQRKDIGNTLAFEREFMLRILPNGEQLVTRSMIRYYDFLPERLKGQSETRYIGVDLAISLRDTADSTAMVLLIVRIVNTNLQIYILPNPVNKKMQFAETIDTVRELHAQFPRTKFIVENVSYQDAAVQSMQSYGIDVKGIKPTTDKRSRLSIIADRIKRGTIRFPRTGCELLIAQLTGYGVEKHDDLMDALTIAIIEIINQQNKPDNSFSWGGDRTGKGLRKGRSIETLQRNTRAQYSHPLHFNEFDHIR